MKARQKCEICGFFKVVGFTDCGLICEECFSKEIQINCFNDGVEKSAQRVEANKNHTAEDIAVIVRQLKMKTHRKENDNLQQR